MRLLEYLNPFDAESKARRADRQSRADLLGNPFLKTASEQVELARQSGGDASVSAAEGYLREGSQGNQMDTGAMSGGFDPSNAESVRQMQRVLNQAGFTDELGNPLAEDGKLGPKTVGALRRMQGGHRSDNASINELKGGQGTILERITDMEVGDRGKEHMYSRDGRGDATIGGKKMAGGIKLTPDADLTSKARQDFFGSLRGGAKSVDDAIERVAPFIGGSGAYRGAKEGVKKFFSGLGNADY